jgi:uncharacterized protein YjiS (DUF1127 family)
MNQLLAKYRTWRAARELNEQLGNLSQRQLADLGLVRSGTPRRPHKHDLGAGPYFY